jgi:Uma2 family endonuclease
MIAAPDVVYPSSDGQPMAENTLQYDWIVLIQQNLDALFRHRPDVFVAADNLIYPKQGDPKVCLAPDTYVAFGRPKGHRASYKVWEEGNIFPQVIFEVLSPKNTPKEMQNKRKFYEKWGAEEYFVIDPEPGGSIEIWHRSGSRLKLVPDPLAFVSPRLGIRFQPRGDEWSVLDPHGHPFRTFADELERGQLERQRTEVERQRAELERQRAEQERLRADRLAQRLRQLGVPPESLD